MILPLLLFLAADLPQFEERMEGDQCVMTIRAQQAMTAYWMAWSNHSTFTDVAGKSQTEFRHTLPGGQLCPDGTQTFAVIYADGTTAGEPEYAQAMIEARREDLAATRRWLRNPKKLREALDQAMQTAPFSESLQDTRNSSVVKGRVRAHALQVRRDLDSKGLDYAIEQLRKREAMLLASKPPLEP